jgi:REP element-mobilizing transposase RayT
VSTTRAAAQVIYNKGAHRWLMTVAEILWSRSFFVASCGGAALAVIKQYIQQQEVPH